MYASSIKGGLTLVLAATSSCVAPLTCLSTTESPSRACVFKPIDGLSYRLLRRVEVLGDTADGVTTFDGGDDLRRRVVKYLVHLAVTNNPVTVESLTRLTTKSRTLRSSQR